MAATEKQLTRLPMVSDRIVATTWLLTNFCRVIVSKKNCGRSSPYPVQMRCTSSSTARIAGSFGPDDLVADKEMSSLG